MMFTPTIKLEKADKRGELYSITLPDDQEFLLLHSKKGSLRGGHSHDVDEVVLLLSGQMRYHKLTPHGEDQTSIMTPECEKYGSEAPGCAVQLHCLSVNTKGHIHMGEFLEDSWLLEYKLNTSKGKWRNYDYAPYRAQVEANAVS